MEKALEQIKIAKAYIKKLGRIYTVLIALFFIAVILFAHTDLVYNIKHIFIGLIFFGIVSLALIGAGLSRSTDYVGEFKCNTQKIKRHQNEQDEIRKLLYVLSGDKDKDDASKIIKDNWPESIARPEYHIFGLYLECKLSQLPCEKVIAAGEVKLKDFKQEIRTLKRKEFKAPIFYTWLQKVGKVPKLALSSAL